MELIKKLEAAYEGQPLPADLQVIADRVRAVAEIRTLMAGRETSAHIALMPAITKN